MSDSSGADGAAKSAGGFSHALTLSIRRWRGDDDDDDEEERLPHPLSLLASFPYFNFVTKGRPRSILPSSETSA